MEIKKSSAEGTDLKQLFAEKLEWGAIVSAVHYGDFDPQNDNEMNAELYDDWAEWTIGGVASRGNGD